MKIRYAPYLLACASILMLWQSCNTDSETPGAPKTAMRAPVLIYPPNPSVGNSRSPVFVWDGHVEEDGDGSFSFTVHLTEEFGAGNWDLPAGVDTVLVFPGTLESETGYYWSVSVTASAGREASSLAGHFVTGIGFNNPPSRPELLFPENASEDNPVVMTFSWHSFDPDGDDITHNVCYRRTDGSDSNYVSGLTDLEYGTILEFESEYIWEVFTIDEHTAYSTSDLCTFQTGSLTPPSNPYPADGATDVPLDVTISWHCVHPAGGALTYDVLMDPGGMGYFYVGTDLTENSLQVPGLTEDLLYMWRVVAKDGQGHSVTGPAWYFTTVTAGSGVFADLTLNRRITRSGVEVLVFDNIWARFDEDYAPQSGSSPLRPDTVICGDYGLEWNGYDSRFYYENAYILDFIVPGTTYQFTVAEGGGVPALTESILFPQCAPMITSPESFQNVSLSGFEVTWSGYDAFSDCNKPVTLEIHELGGVPTGVSITTDNDGSYTFTAEDLSLLDPSLLEFEIVLIMENVINIVSPGFDPRSWVRARATSVVSVYSY